MPATSRCPDCNCWRTPDGRPCRGCAYWTRRAHERSAGRRCHDCATLIPPDTLSRCTPCRTTRQGPDRDHRRQLAAAKFSEVTRKLLLARLADGEHLSEVLTDLELTPQQVYGWRAFDPAWADALDGALMSGRDPALQHGTVMTYRHGHCRCPECKEAKRRPPLWWRQRPTSGGRQR